MKTKILLFVVAGISFATNLLADDVLIFGNSESETSHSVYVSSGEVYTGTLKQKALRLLPVTENDYKGGILKFVMNVKPNKQNYCTVRFSGDEVSANMMMLFIDGKQIGYRHLGDIDYLSSSVTTPPLLGRFYYVTLPLPIKYTKGREKINLEIRSYGRIWGYGSTIEKYQKNMVDPCLGIYKIYTHTETCFIPSVDEIQGEIFNNSVRPEKDGEKVIFDLKAFINKELEKLISRDLLRNQLEIWTLAQGYITPWTVAYKNDRVLKILLKSYDDFYNRYKKNPQLVIKDKTINNSDWSTTAPLAQSIRLTWNDLQHWMTVKQKDNYSVFFKASLDYASTHRRSYTNQSMIIDLYMYDVNRALALIKPTLALPQEQVLKYLYESIGLLPWSGINNEYPMGKDYWQLTTKGLTKELGFVGYYGEVLDWISEIYATTCGDDRSGKGDEKILKQLINAGKARTYFRYPALDDEGYRCMRMEALVGWRDFGHYPAEIAYAERGLASESTPLMMAYITKDPEFIGMAQQMLDDNQFFNMVRTKLGTSNARAMRGLMHIPEQYKMIKGCKPQSTRMPMSGKDFVFSDEEDGVVAVKNGDEILYASLYWRARFGVNNLAKVHCVKPNYDVMSNIHIKTIVDDSGMRYIRPNWVNFGFNGNREFYKDIESAHRGDTLVIAKIPDGSDYKIGKENPYAGKALYYEMQYGDYIIGMNSSKNNTYWLSVPSDDSYINLTNKQSRINSKKVSIPPMTTIVLYKNKS